MCPVQLFRFLRLPLETYFSGHTSIDFSIDSKRIIVDDMDFEFTQ
jgi:hypothetical protein